MHDKLKLLLDKIKLPEKYYSFFECGKILKLKLDSTRKNGVFVIEVENIIEKEVFDFISNNIHSSFKDMHSMKASFVVRNINYNEALKYYPDAIDNSTLTKPMKELFKEKKVSISDNNLVVEIDNVAEENILTNNSDSILSYFKSIGFDNIKLDFNINLENSKMVREEL